MTPLPVMVLAAGLGTRMRPITDTMPKPLVSVAGRTMLDRVLDSFADAGTQQAVINTHYLPEQIEAHCAARQRPPAVRFSPEPDERLETGGGIAKALPMLGATFFTTNADSFWVGDANALPAMRAAFDPARMDMLLLVAPVHKSIGMGAHKGDFARDPDGRLTRRGARPSVDWNYTGTAIMTASLFADAPSGPFSLNLLFDRAIAEDRLYGHALEGLWLTVGTPDAIGEAEAALKAAGQD